MVFRTGRAARRDSHENAPSPLIQYLQAPGLRSGVGVPIVVGGRLWGAANVGSSRPEPLPAGTEARVGTSRTWSPPRLRTAEVSMPPDWRALREKVSDVVAGLTGVSEDLQEISRGIHPAILSRGGPGPALKTLARRSAVPVQLRLGTDRRLPKWLPITLSRRRSRTLPSMRKHLRRGWVSSRLCELEVVHCR
jgi:hypothetical protein